MKLTNKHFKHFKEVFKKYQLMLNLNNWKIYFYFEKLEDAIADVGTNYEGRIADVRLTTQLETTAHYDIKDLIEETALHECLELLLSPLMVQARHRSFNEEEYQHANHSVIRTLEKLLK